MGQIKQIIIALFRFFFVICIIGFIAVALMTMDQYTGLRKHNCYYQPDLAKTIENTCFFYAGLLLLSRIRFRRNISNIIYTLLWIISVSVLTVQNFNQRNERVIQRFEKVEKKLSEEEIRHRYTESRLAQRSHEQIILLGFFIFVISTVATVKNYKRMRDWNMLQKRIKCSEEKEREKARREYEEDRARYEKGQRNINEAIDLIKKYRKT